MEQTVDRVAAPPASHRTAMSAGSRSRDDGPRPTHEMQLALLPVRSGRELSLGLARQWQDWSGAAVAVVFFGFTHLGRKWIARSECGKLPQVAESSFDRREAEGGLEACAAASGFGSEVKVAASVPFSTGPNAVGGVLLDSARECEVRGQDCDWLTALSGKLVDQAGIVEAASADRRALEAAKTAAIAEFAAGAGHEINNPLATIAGRVQMLLRDETDFNRRQDLATIGAQSLRVRDMIGDLMLFARPPSPTPKRLLLNELAQSVIDRFRQTPQTSRNIRINIAAQGAVFATADPACVQIVLSELLRNSLEAVDSVSETVEGEIVVRLERSGCTQNPAAIIAVSDNGPGLSDRDRAHLFDPYYSGREAGRGLGFGLCKCWRIANRHGGWIEFDSVPGVATTFRVFWPDAAADSSDESRESPLVV